MGYIEETGLAQHMRDARVLAIYEGTNGIQANDLVFRKLTGDDGAAFRNMLDEVVRFLPELTALPGDDAQIMHKHLSRALKNLRDTGEWMLKQAKEDVAVAAAVAMPFLQLMGNAVGGYYLIKSAAIAQKEMSQRTGDPAFFSAKIITARFYAEHVLPACGSLAITVMEGAATTLSASEEMF
jgi:hypothetical protein